MNHGLVRIQCESIPVKGSNLRTNDEAVAGFTDKGKQIFNKK